MYFIKSVSSLLSVSLANKLNKPFLWGNFFIVLDLECMYMLHTPSKSNHKQWKEKASHRSSTALTPSATKWRQKLRGGRLMSLALSRGGFAVNVRWIRRGKRISLVDIRLWVMVTPYIGGDVEAVAGLVGANRQKISLIKMRVISTKLV